MNVRDAARAFLKSFRQTDLVLYAGTNLAFPSLCGSELEEIGMMPAIGSAGEKQQPNVALLTAIEQTAATLLKELFSGDFAEARFQSCTQANLALFLALSRPHDHVLCLYTEDGGHPSQNGDGIPAHLALTLHPLPFDAEHQCIDDGACSKLVERIRPKIVILGPSTILRPSVIAETVRAARRYDAVLIVDVSHVAGLIAGGTFPNPLDAGANLITASSYKTLACPPAGFIVGRGLTQELQIRAAVSPKMLSNYDAGRLLRFTAALGQARGLLAPYARAVITNTLALRAALCDEKLSPVLPAADAAATHQTLLRVASKSAAFELVMALQRGGITTSACALPGERGNWALRLGTQLVTRRGMGPGEMRQIAAIIAAVARPTSKLVPHAEVARITRRFPAPVLCEQAL